MLYATSRPALAPRPVVSPSPHVSPEPAVRGFRARGLVKFFEAGITGCSARVRALNAVDLDVRPGDVVALVGEPGSGKSTLLLIAAGMLRHDAGSIVWYTDVGATVKNPGNTEYLPPWRSGHALLSLRRAAAALPGVLLLDNSLFSLDSASRREAGAIIRQMRAEHVTMLIAARNPSECSWLQPRVVRMRGGRII